MNTKELKKLDRRHVVYSWKAQAGVDPIVIDRAEGIYMWDTDGKRYIDGCSGLLNINIGHGNRHVLEAMKAQMEKLCYVSPGFSTEPKARLAGMVAEVTSQTAGPKPSRTPSKQPAGTPGATRSTPAGEAITAAPPERSP